MRAFESLRWKSIPQPPEVARHSLKKRAFAPDSSIGASPKARAVALLRAAAEVEHQFIAQYLYALYCGASQLEAPLSSIAGELMTIAQEEMGHLLTVQNLLAALGERPYWARIGGGGDVQEPFPFALEPFGLPFVARFLVAESTDNASLPAGIEQHLPAGLPLDKIAHVGAIYRALYWLFQDPHAPMGPWSIPLGSDVSAFESLGHLSDADFVDPSALAPLLSLASEWDGATDRIGTGQSVLVMPRNDFEAERSRLRLAALTAIHSIAAQGEGPVSPQANLEPGHAARLRTIYDRLVTAPALPPLYPTNPYLVAHTADPATEESLLRGEAATRGASFDATYERLLLTIARSVRSPASSDRAEYAGRAISLMFALGSDAGELAGTGRQGQDDPRKAGPPFTFPAAGIPDDLADIDARLAPPPVPS